MNIKSILAVAAVTAFSSPVLAGPYVGVDTKSKFTGNNYGSTEFTGKIGYAGALGEGGTKYFVEGGPIITVADGGTETTELRINSGLAFALTDSVGAKVGGKFTSNDGGDNKYEFLTGIKYSF